MRFTKMHGLGNDFVVVDGPWHPDPQTVAALCDRHRGVGADGVLVVSNQGGVVVMGYWNADGSPAEMCGNGLRCVARYAVDRGFVPGPDLEVDTPAGRRQAQVESAHRIKVELGEVSIQEPVEIDGRRFIPIGVGNPHAVTFVDDVDHAPVATLGPRIEHHTSFPQGTNVEFVTVLAADRIRMRVWERGVGETLACGSGMVAAAAAHRQSHPAPAIAVQVPGGEGEVSFEGNVAWLAGPAVYVFTGEWPD